VAPFANAADVMAPVTSPTRSLGTVQLDPNGPNSTAMPSASAAATAESTCGPG